MNFTEVLKLKHPLVVAPMAGDPSSSELVIASSSAGALGSIGAAYSSATEIEAFAAKVRGKTSRPIAINLFIPHSPPQVSEFQISRAIESTEIYRKELELPRPTLIPPYEENFDHQFEAVLKVRPEVFSFVFGLLKKEYVQAAKKEKIFLIGTATTLDEALALQETEVDAVTLQGYEAGGHRGIFDPESSDPEILTFDLISQCQNKIKIPIIAAGGIMTAQDIQSAFSRGAHAVQMGTAFLACSEAGTSVPYRQALLEKFDRRTKITRVFSGRFARGIENRFMQEMENKTGSILPFPAQNRFTRDLRKASLKMNSSEFLSLWCGSGKGKLWTGPTAELIDSLFENKSF